MRRNVGIAGGALCLWVIAATLAGCATRSQTGAAVGGTGGAASGAAAGAASGAPAAGVGALIGGAAGAIGGGIIGASQEKNNEEYRDEAMRVAEAAKRNPAVASAVRNAPTADLNGDGWTTLDEIVAMKKAGLSDEQMTQRLRSTQQVFYLTTAQRDYLIDEGISRSIIDSLQSMNANVAGHRMQGAAENE